MTAPATPSTPPAAQERVVRVRGLLAGVEGRLGIVRDVPVAGEAPAHLPPSRALPVSDEVAPLLPGGVLRRGTVVAVEGSTSLVLALIARASLEGAWSAIVGMPHVGVVAAARRGVDLARLALVPHPGAEAAVLAGACVDGMDVVVLGPRLALGDADRRRLAARARERGVVLVSAGPWAGAHVALRASRASWEGLGAGEGRLKSRTLVVSRSGRHLGAPDEATVLLDTEAAPFPGRAAQARRGLRIA